MINVAHHPFDLHVLVAIYSCIALFWFLRVHLRELTDTSLGLGNHVFGQPLANIRVY